MSPSSNSKAVGLRFTPFKAKSSVLPLHWGPHGSPWSPGGRNSYSGVTIRRLPPTLLPGAGENHPKTKVRVSVRGFIQGIFDPEGLWRCDLPFTGVEFVISSEKNRIP